MPFKMPADLRAKLDALEAATREVKEAARAVAKDRAPLAKAVRDIQRHLERSQKSLQKMRSWHGWEDRAYEIIHGQRWRDTLARITALQSQLVDAELRLAFFDQDHQS